MYLASLSCRSIIYKGMFLAQDVAEFFPDLKDDRFESAFALYHQRYSTNTFPQWWLAQPFRMLAHNGEINTLKGNTNWMKSHEIRMSSDAFGDTAEDIKPVIPSGSSDSAALDSVFEMLVRAGRNAPMAKTMLVPESWSKQAVDLPKSWIDMYSYCNSVMEPWDGPASIAFTDGRYIGAVLDRNGLRPSRYYLTHDDRVIMASEVGVVDVDPSNVKVKGRLEPGRMFLIDFENGSLIPDAEIKADFASRKPYAEWVQNSRLSLKNLPKPEAQHLDRDTLLPRMQSFGYTTETMQFMLLPLIRDLRDPVGSMGNDSALACLSDKPRMIYDYFKQMFAQVTNPPIDSIREEIIMSLECHIGPEANLLQTEEANCARLRIRHPILSNEGLEALKQINYRGWTSRTVDITYPLAEAPGGLVGTIERICAEAEAAIDEGFSVVLLSDRAAGADRLAVSALLATGAVHHHLVATAKRSRIAIVLETAEAREVHHHCLLVGYGADAINPYLAFEALWQARRDGLIDTTVYPNDDEIVVGYRRAVAKGMLKVMARMGISTLQSYKGAQIFEALGLRTEVIDRCFSGTASRLQGVSFDVLEEESIRRHNLAYPARTEDRLPALPNPGDFHWRSAGERHAWTPNNIANLQSAARTLSLIHI